MKPINLIKTTFVVVLIAFLASCKKDDVSTQKNNTTFKVKADYVKNKSIALKSTDPLGVELNSFKINIEEIEIEFDDDDPLFATDSIASDYELDGPFEIDLLKDGNPLKKTIASNVELPAAAYDEIEFKFRESENPISDMFGKSILIKGTIDGKPFVFWTDEEVEVEIEFDKLAFIDESSKAIFTISFNLTALFDTNNGGIDITAAKDGNGNGIIEIYPGDPDGNNDLADAIWEKIEDIIDAFEEQYDN